MLRNLDRSLEMLSVIPTHYQCRLAPNQEPSCYIIVSLDGSQAVGRLADFDSSLVCEIFLQFPKAKWTQAQTQAQAHLRNAHAHMGARLVPLIQSRPERCLASLASLQALFACVRAPLPEQTKQCNVTRVVLAASLERL